MRSLTFVPRQDAFGSDDPSLEWVSFPMGCIKAVTQTDEDNLAITITAKVRTSGSVHRVLELDLIAPYTYFEGHGIRRRVCHSFHSASSISLLMCCCCRTEITCRHPSITSVNRIILIVVVISCCIAHFSRLPSFPCLVLSRLNLFLLPASRTSAAVGYACRPTMPCSSPP